MLKEGDDFQYVEIDRETWNLVSEHLGTDDPEIIESWIVKTIVSYLEDLGEDYLSLEDE